VPIVSFLDARAIAYGLYITIGLHRSSFSHIKLKRKCLVAQFNSCLSDLDYLSLLIIDKVVLTVDLEFSGYAVRYMRPNVTQAWKVGLLSFITPTVTSCLKYIIYTVSGKNRPQHSRHNFDNFSRSFVI